MKKERTIPVYSMVFGGLTAVCFIIHMISLASKGFSDVFNRTVGAFFRTVLSYITGWIPVSFAEILLILLIPSAIALIVYIVKIAKDCKKLIKTLIALGCVLSYIYCSFVLTFAVAYRGSKLEDKLGLERSELSASELIYVWSILAEKLEEYTSQVTFGNDSLSVMPYSHKELNKKLNSAYKKAAEKYDFISALKSNVKDIMLSEPMTYTHISGVYTFFTGEANLNVNYPDFVLPFTMAHEMAHQRGIAREDEANFVAFLVCLESDDPYILYSTYNNMLRYYFSPLNKADRDSYVLLRNALPAEFNAEATAYSKFFDKYRESVASDISDKVNDTYLQMQGQPAGRQSYGLVVELTYAYYKSLE